MAIASGTEMRCKKRCCKSAPRCKRCPVAWKRLSAEDLARRTGKRTYVTTQKVRKKALAAARGR